MMFKFKPTIRIEHFFMLLALISCLLVSCKASFKEQWTTKRAPEYFKARFETTKGNFDIEAKRMWSPKAVDRLYQLIKYGYYTDIAIYRVIPNFVAQFGIHNDSIQSTAWSKIKVDDEPVVEKNVKGTLAFARAGQKTRDTNLFINLKNNSPYLDSLSYSGVTGFPVVAKITSGLDVVESFYSGYGSQLDKKQGIILKKGNRYLKKEYPKLDYIYKAYLINY